MRNVLIACLFVAACGPSSTGIDTVSCPTDSTLTYANFGAAFMEANCLSCHDGNERPSLATQSGVQANMGHILDEAVYTDSMPEDADMTIAEREMLGEWIACGAP